MQNGPDRTSPQTTSRSAALAEGTFAANKCDLRGVDSECFKHVDIEEGSIHLDPEQSFLSLQKIQNRLIMASKQNRPLRIAGIPT